ncbi:AAA family ATPase, partial [Ignavibacterium album]|uniref:AAA family ATPase n=1 Tax=Ignavibacterium album TaxID=591197 RepID=UPI0038B3EFCA
FHQSTKVYDREGLDLSYLAPECINSLYSPQSDIYSAGVVLYQLLFGKTPWYSGESNYLKDRVSVSDMQTSERNKPLEFPQISNDFIGYDDRIHKILEKALHPDLDFRFDNCGDFLDALISEKMTEDNENKKGKKPDYHEREKIPKSFQKFGGFSAIAGLTELKNEMQRSVIDILKNPQKAQKYGAKIPNGMILYGPPGCGKTFFAKQFAEEVGYNFILATPSTLKSRFVNATQENIAKMFDEAAKNAPTIIFIDEINELLPNRDSESHEMSKSAVNEMLAQMDRTGEKGIFVIGACNNPNTIDPAMLRAGRLEKKFYLSPPDTELRKALFKNSLNLRKKVLDFGLDYDRLSNLTDNFVSADIEAIVNEATSIAMAENSKISMKLLEDVIKRYLPFPSEELQKYEMIKVKFEGKVPIETNEKPRIGFKI